MATKITQEDIIKMNELYLRIGTYAGVSREMGGSPSASTVKKYIIPGYTPAASVIKQDAPELPPFDTDLFKEDILHWGPRMVMQQDERKEIEELWKEMLV